MFRIGLLAAWLCAAAHAEVLVLDVAGGGDFITLQEVVLGAQDGDIVLVRPGVYVTGTVLSVVTFGGKSLTIIADGTGPVDFPSIWITGIGAGQTFVLRGVRLVAGDPFGPGPIRLLADNSEGTILIEDCLIAGKGNDANVEISSALKIVDASVVIESCEILGGPGLDDEATFKPAGWALKVLAGRVTVSDSILLGGAGASETLGNPFIGAGPGGDALHAIDSDVTISGCTLTGGVGGHDTGTPSSSQAAPAGGSALVADVTSLVRLRDSVLTGGAGGTDASGVDGPDGADIDAPAASVVQLAGEARTVHVDAPTAEGNAGQIQSGGEPGELLLLLVSLDGAWIDVPKFDGVLLVGSQAAGPIVLGSPDGTGELRTGFVVPDLGMSPGTGVRAITQVVGLAGTSAVLGDASVSVILAGP